MELQDKKYRILDIFFRLLKGEFVSVRQLADEYSVSGKTVSRDINEIRAYLSENEYRNGNAQIEYSHREKAYYLSMDDFLSSKELLVLCRKTVWKKYDYSVQSHSSTCDETKEDE